MKNGIIKIWVCQNCQKEYLNRQVICSKCDKFEFDVKYGGIISDEEELSKLIETYREEAVKDAVKAVKANRRGAKKVEKPDTPDEKSDTPDEKKRTRLR